MATGKKSFVLYADLINTVAKMPTEKAGELFLHILRYVNDENPEIDDILVEIAFEPIKSQLKRDLEKWEKLKEKRSKAGKKSAESRRNKVQQNEQVLTSVHFAEQTLTHREQTSANSTVNVNDNVNVNVNDTVNVNVSSKEDLFNKKIELENELLNSHTFQEQAFRQLTALGIKTELKELIDLIPVFCEKLEIENDLDKNLSQQRGHFVNWAKAELRNQNKLKNGKQTTKQRTNKSYGETFNELKDADWSDITNKEQS